MLRLLQNPSPLLRHLSTSALQDILWGKNKPQRRRRRLPPSTHLSDHLLNTLKAAVETHRLDEAWTALDRLHSSTLLPPSPLLCALISSACYHSNDRHHLYRAAQIAHRWPLLLHHHTLSSLAISLSRSHLPGLSGDVLRLMLQSNKLPNSPLWPLAFTHLVRSPAGCHVATHVLLHLCELFLSSTALSKRWDLLKPDVSLFNLVLLGCAKFGDSLVAHQVFEVMLKIGLTADLTSLAAIAKICEMNGLREDLRKLSSFVDSAASLSLNHHCCRSFYESLLSLHFKFNDLDAASGLIVGLYRRSGAALPRAQIPESAVLQVGSGNLKAGSKLLIKLSPLERGLFIEPERRSDLIVLEGGNVLPSKRAVAKLVLGYIRQKKTGDLAKVLVEIQKAVGLSSLLNFSLGFEVVVSSVELGWLEAAHDVLDDMESAGFLSPEAVYVLLLKAYFDKSMVREARALLKQMRERKLIKFPDEDEDEEEVINSYLAQHEKRASPVASSSLTKLLEKQSKEGGDSQSHLTHEFNFSIFFFCKAGMMEDAIKTYRKMQEKRVLPSIQTFSHLVNGYSSKEMYREITIVWGEMRRRLEEGVLSADRDLLGSFLWNFIRGGYFERAMDIATYLEDSGIYIDKWRFREEFLRLHRNLYRSLNMCDARTEVQSKRLEHVRAFRKWVGIDGEKRTRARG